MEALFFYLTATSRNGGTRQTERGLPASSFFSFTQAEAPNAYRLY